MRSSGLCASLREGRKRLGLSRADIAERADVSVRLVAEFERGERPNVSLETALRLLEIVGLSVSATRRGSSKPATSAERAKERRRTWTSGHFKRGDPGGEPPEPHTGEQRIKAVAEVSRLAYAIATAGERSREGRPASARKK